MREIEKQIQEKRSIEATKKKLMGFNGKLGCIARNLGQPIIVHSDGGGYHDHGSAIDPWALPDEEDDSYEPKQGTPDEIMQQIPTMEMDGVPQDDPTGKEWSDPRERIQYYVDQTGWYFDGLSRGMHLDIKYEDLSKTLVASYEGYEVYRETAGELKSYAPSPAWEDKVEQLYSVAMKMDLTKKREERKEEIEEAKKQKEEWWKTTREKWGL